MEELFKLLTNDIHFNVTELSSKTWNKNWKVPEGLISIVGLEDGKRPVFYYGVVDNYKEDYLLNKGVSENNNKFVNARMYFKFDRNDVMAKERYVVANGFNGLLLCIKIDKDKFTKTFEKILLEKYNEGEEHIVEVLDKMMDRNMFDSVEESVRYITNRDYNWLIGRLKYKAGLFNYSGQGYWLLPLKTNMKITKGFKLTDNEIIVDLENTELFKNYLIYVDIKDGVIKYNKDRLCKSGFSLVDEIRKQMSDDTCPWCGEKLRLVKTKRGEFLGCSNYPECLYRRFLKNNNKK
ncbi:topoisomerase DNA-binding C4 zinc finger domain-containing protein [Methanothermococcus sp. SCGC AD-155-C09]|nr:topoisomerase DNA-binding C4 zinc finger domain-containing protein [Methanothermococcus sp. SCGC AD-155-C09]